MKVKLKVKTKYQMIIRCAIKKKWLKHSLTDQKDLLNMRRSFWPVKELIISYNYYF